MNYSKQYTTLNEARGVTRTIDPKLWASVSSACSKTYKNDLGVSAKPIGTRDQLLQRFIAGLIILKQHCPITENDMKNCPAFSQWANKLIDMGVTMEEVHKLWNENCGKLPKVDTTIINDISDNNDIIEDNIEDNDVSPMQQNTLINVVDDADELDDDVIDDVENNEMDFNSPEVLMNKLHKVLFPQNKTNSEFNLHGCSNPAEAFKRLFSRDLMKEHISECDNLDELQQLTTSGDNMLFACRVIGGEPEEVVGDVVWCENNMPNSYYIVAGPNVFKIYYKEDNGELSLSAIGNPNQLK